MEKTLPPVDGLRMMGSNARSLRTFITVLRLEYEDEWTTDEKAAFVEMETRLKGFEEQADTFLLAWLTKPKQCKE